MKIISWNVNGLKACWEKGLKEFISSTDADIICLQETKLQEEFEPLTHTEYFDFWNFSMKKGYSGTMCLTKNKPIDVSFGINNEIFDSEGRVITLEYENYFIVNCYVPNSKGSLERFYFRMDWDEAFREYLCYLQRIKPVIVCGDFNVAYDYIDIYPENLLNSDTPTGFLDEERDGLSQLYENGFTDSFRYFFPKQERAYSWWSNRLNKRIENKGWRLDYCLISNSIIHKAITAGILNNIYGSDHCPIFLEVDI